MTRSVVTLALLFGVAVSSASAQSLGTFRWQLQPYGSVLNLEVTQQGGVFLLAGFEAQCGDVPKLPASGIALVQPDGSVALGITTINERGRGLHTRAVINTADFNGVWVDNAGNNFPNPNLVFRFNPGNTCPGGPRTDPTSPDANGPTVQALLDQIATLSARLAALEAKK